VIVVSDTSPITSLVDVGHVELLRTLFSRVIVPREVARELERGHVGVPVWVEVHDATDRSMVSRFEAEVDLGEAEALALAVELKADRLLIDERQGRAIAERVGLRYIGVLGVLLEAKRRGHLSTIRPVLDQLVATAGFWISDRLRREVLTAAGEQ
jgi:hypothetical protein